jgi:hypothetical protein
MCPITEHNGIGEFVHIDSKSPKPILSCRMYAYLYYDVSSKGCCGEADVGLEMLERDDSNCGEEYFVTIVGRSDGESPSKNKWERME